MRQVRYKQPQRYLEAMRSGAPLAEERAVPRADVGFEFMLNALRLTDGFPAARFAERTGFALAMVQRQVDEAERLGLLERDHKRIWPTPLGRRFLNDLQAIFLPPEAAHSAAAESVPTRPLS